MISKLQQLHLVFAAIVVAVVVVFFFGPIPWGHSGPLCHALSSLSSLSWTSHASYSYSAGGVRCPRHRQRQRVTEGTAMAPWNGPNQQKQRVMCRFHTYIMYYRTFILLVLRLHTAVNLNNVLSSDECREVRRPIVRTVLCMSCDTSYRLSYCIPLWCYVRLL